MRKIYLLATLLISSFTAFPQNKIDIPDNANIFIIASSTQLAQYAGEQLESLHHWHIVNDKSKSDYTIKFNLFHTGLTHWTGNADIYKGSDIVTTTKSVSNSFGIFYGGGIAEYQKHIISKLIEKRF